MPSQLNVRFAVVYRVLHKGKEEKHTNENALKFVDRFQLKK